MKKLSSNRVLLYTAMSIGIFTSFTSACAGQEAPGAFYPGPKEPLKQAEVAPLGYAVEQNRPQPLWLGSLSEQESRLRVRPPVEQVGVRRQLSRPLGESATVTTLPGGRALWRASLSSTDAVGLRVHFRNFSVGRGKVWVYAAPVAGEAVQSDGPYTESGPLGDGEFWSGVIWSDAVTVEYESDQPGAVPFEVDAVTHLWKQAPATLAEAPGPRPSADFPGPPGEAGYCNLDVSCYPEYANTASGVVVFYVSGDDGNAWSCSGAIVNTKSGSFKPYLLTAGHCIHSDSEARTVQAFFKYQTSTCNGTPPSASSLPNVNYARLLARGGWSQGDFAFALLNSDAPRGTYFLGWNASGINQGDSAVGIHHPKGSWTRISMGTRVADDDGSVEGALAPAQFYYQIRWSQGVTESGSSGSPLFNSNNQIVGMDSYGPTPPPDRNVCYILPETVGYGRFSNAYPSISQYLNDDVTAPTLAVNPTSLRFVASNGSFSTPSQQTFRISTQSPSSIPFNLTGSASWIKLSAQSGSVSAQSSATVTVSVDLSYFSNSASVTGSVTVTSGTLAPLTVSIQADITVSGPFISNQRVTTSAPPASGCAVPVAVTSFLTTDSTVYLYYQATVTTSDSLSTDWLAPDGSVIAGKKWNPAAGTYCFTGASLSIRDLPATRLGSWQARVYNHDTLLFSVPFTVLAPGQAANPPLRFVPVPPCRVGDTRASTNKLGFTGARDFPVAGACNVPAAAQAYSLNVSAIPRVPSLGFLAIWPAGQPQPGVSTLNSYDGRAKANAALVPAGVNGAVSVHVSEAADVFLDINGYFVPGSSAPAALVYYPVAPCRAGDTRTATNRQGFTGQRTIPIVASGCGVPAGAQAYAINFTAIPRTSSFSFLSAWPTGQTQPGVSTLNAFTGAVTANAAIVPAGTNGSIDVYHTDRADLLVDVNGYFAPPGAGGLSFYVATPCRAVDTRTATNKLGFFGTQDFSIPTSACSLPVASAYALNATVLPRPQLDFLSLWAAGGTQPAVSTLNSFDGSVVSNAAIVPASAAGSVTAYHTQPADLLLDVNGYFAP